MCNEIFISNDAQSHIQELSKLSKVYVSAPIQQSKYNEILAELRAIYSQNKQNFSSEDVALIKKLKEKIETKPQPYIEQKLRPLKFSQRDEHFGATSYVQPKAHHISSGTVVFHKVDYCVGVVVDWNPVHRTYKLLFCTDNCEWYKLDDLLAIGTCSKIWKSTRAAHCWQCKEPLGTGDKECKRCNWYICPECRACGCDA